MNQNKSKINNLISLNIEESELKNQLENYHNLKINQSYRGISVLIIFAISIISVLAIFYLKDGLEAAQPAYLGIAIYLFVALFVNKGRRWAIIVAMILWTSDKTFYIYQIMHMGGDGAVVVFVFWLIVMRFFWRALEVENAKKKLDQKENGSEKS